MAKLPSEILDRQILQLLRTSGSDEYIQAVLPESAASGELAIQLTEGASGTSLWTLAKDGQTAVQFVSKDTVAYMIETGASDAVDNIIDGVGLNPDGTYAPKQGTNYLDSATTIEEEVGSFDSLLGKVESDPADSADTVFDSTNTVAKTISDIKKDLAAFKNKLSLSGKENAYAKVTIVSADSGTTIEVSAKTQEVSTATAAEQGLADAYDVRTFAVKGVNSTTLATSAGVKVEVVDGNNMLDFTELKVDCGEF